MRGFVANIEEISKANTNFRHVLYTGHNAQLVVMSIAPGSEIGMEIHPDNDQFLRFESGTGKVIIDGNEHDVSDGFAVVVPAGSEHDVVNVSQTEPLQLYTLYSPPHHQDGLVRATKKDAEAHEIEFDGVTSE
ncbi:MAG: cupin domain-containing protein [Candidatus Nomurabacteria bacterium]|nr:MAG: cupin domain-containing protein [Candidatus Nomurabacteria bacterium]